MWQIFAKSAISRTLKKLGRIFSARRSVEEADVLRPGSPGSPASLMEGRRSGGRSRRARPTSRARAVGAAVGAAVAAVVRRVSAVVINRCEYANEYLNSGSISAALLIFDGI